MQLGADVAQLAEHLICNQAVASSTLAVSSEQAAWSGIAPSGGRGVAVGYPSGQREQTVNLPASRLRRFESFPHHRGADLRTRQAEGGAGSRRRTSSVIAGVAQLVEREPSKLDVAGSSPVSRSSP